MKTIILTSLVFFAAPALACSVMPGFEIPHKNNMIASVANKYSVDTIEDEITVANYKHSIAWKFTDGAFQCHDSDTVSADITMKYKSKWDEKRCETVVSAKQVSEPVVKEGERETTLTITEVSSSCK